MPTERRRWYSSLVILPLTALRTVSMFRRYELHAFVPFLPFLFTGAVVLWMVNAIAPLAPFIYSLF
jgi:hypothetical protein